MPVTERDGVFAEKRFYGIYRGIVKDNRDPQQLGRLKVQVPEVYGVADLTDWAWPKNGYSSGMDKGDFVVPDVEDGVWLEFEAGDPCRPVWSGRWWGKPQAVSEVPKLARGTRDASQQPPKGTDMMTLADGRSAAEPPISYAAQYPLNKVFKTKQGIIVELDDTPGAIRLHFWHPAQTWLEVHPDGSLVERVAQERYTCIVVDDRLHVKGDWDICVEGNCTLRVDGNWTVRVGGDKIEKIAGDFRQEIGGDFEQTVDGQIMRQSAVGITDQSGNNSHM